MEIVVFKTKETRRLSSHFWLDVVVAVRSSRRGTPTFAIGLANGGGFPEFVLTDVPFYVVKRVLGACLSRADLDSVSPKQAILDAYYEHASEDTEYATRQEQE